MLGNVTKVVIVLIVQWLENQTNLENNEGLDHRRNK